jgi:hypothetical protein
MSYSIADVWEFTGDKHLNTAYFLFITCLLFENLHSLWYGIVWYGMV